MVGGGGREHALAWRLAQGRRVRKVYLAPGNGATAADERYENLAIEEPAALREWAQHEQIALTVVGPEAPLAAGVVDEFRTHGLRIFGPTRAAAQLESSKAFSKSFMKRHGIPTAEHESFADAAAAHAYVDKRGAPIVVKADGLAAGKGVVVATTLAEAHAAIDSLWGEDVPIDSAGASNAPRVVIEDWLEGEEASFIVLVDGKNVTALATSQDHKRLRDGDAGPNTGGMGAYSPAPVVNATVHARAMREIILPTVRGMAQDGLPYTGFLYAGLMIDAKGQVKTLEFNCRLGDPEAQVILLRLKSDLFEVLWHATDGTLDQVELAWDRRTALGVVMAAYGYPAQPRQGDLITGIPDEAGDAVVFQAGTVRDGGALRTRGGRVLCVTALADSVKLAQQRAYEIVAGIHFDGAQYRRDIAHRAFHPVHRLGG